MHRGISGTAGIDCREIADKFNLDEIESIDCLPCGPFSSVFRLRCRQGVFCLKMRQAEEGEIEKENMVAAHFASTGKLLMPLTLPAADGRLVASIGGQTWTLSAFIEADPPFSWTEPAWDSPICYQAGSALRRFHVGGLDLAPVLDKEPGLAEILPGRLERAYRSLSNMRWPSLDMPPSVRLAISMQDEVKEALEQALVAAAESPASGQTLVHGDWHPGNLLFRGGRLACVVDLEHVRADHALWDLGYAAVLFCAAWADDPAVDGVIDPRLFHALLRGYSDGDGSRLPAREPLAAAVHPYMVASCHLLIYWLLERYASAAPAELPAIERALAHALRALSRQIRRASE